MTTNKIVINQMNDLDKQIEQASNFEPVMILEVELSLPLQPVPERKSTKDQPYKRAQVLVRLHTAPLGIVELPLTKDGLSTEDLALYIWDTLSDEINEHLDNDNLATISTLPAAGLPYTAAPKCREEYDAFLIDAPFVSVILCTRNRAEKLDNCFKYLLALDYPRYEVLVVDNASSSTATSEKVKQYEASNKLRYVREDRPGLSWARNCGLKHAAGEIVAFVDDDEEVDPNWLTELVRGFYVVDDAACVTGMILPAELETQAQGWFEQFGGFSKGRGFNQRIFNVKLPDCQHPMFPSPPFGAGGNMAFKTDMIRQVGGFDNALGAGTSTLAAEDTAAFYDVLVQGYSLVFQPSAILHHYHYPTYSGLQRQLYAYGTGLSAFITHCLLKNPLRVFSLVALVPRVLHYLFSPRSPGKSKMQSDYPADLTATQRKGMLKGVPAYIQTRRQQYKQFGQQ